VISPKVSSMIRFSCPVCRKVLKAPEHGVGRKVPCPRCGQRLQIPPPVPVQNKTILGQPMQASGGSSATLTCSCPHCGRAGIPFEMHEAHTVCECARCGGKFTPLGGAVADGFGPGPAPSPDPFDNLSAPEPPEYQPYARAGEQAALPKHSGLGMASFVIALLVGGLDVVLAVAIATGIARSAPRDDWGEFQFRLVSGGVAMYCMNCTSIPLCLVGVGLAVVGMVAHRDHNHLFSRIGLLGNGVVILGVLGFHLYSVALAG
jgi:hypothetical protein